MVEAITYSVLTKIVAGDHNIPDVVSVDYEAMAQVRGTPPRDLHLKSFSRFIFNNNLDSGLVNGKKE